MRIYFCSLGQSRPGVRRHCRALKTREDHLERRPVSQGDGQHAVLAGDGNIEPVADDLQILRALPQRRHPQADDVQPVEEVAAEGARFAQVINEFTDQVRELGPSPLRAGRSESLAQAGEAC